jgi:peptidoglycan/xylan/chitin deacetylase (PgdA/CDA1 family)
MKELILTIDDAPSPLFSDVLDYLVGKGICAIIFVRGDFVAGHEQELADAIKKGFIIGNHSYSHPHFDKLSAKAAREEIVRADKIVDDIYRLSGRERGLKYFRFPYGVGGTPETEGANQNVLAELGYSAPRFASRRDWYWDIPLLYDWHIDESNLQEMKERARQYLLGAKTDATVLVVHDKEPNVRLGLFQYIIEEAEKQRFSFCDRNELYKKLL